MYSPINPVVFIIFNRPSETRITLSEIAKFKPKKLYIIADGARSNRPGESVLVNKTRSLIDEIVDWECEVVKNYSDINMGCCQRIKSGLDYVFSKENSAIILEDDCVPSESFFLFMDNMLSKHKNNFDYYSVSGSNFSEEKFPVGWYKSNYPLMWGWGTWSTRWEKYKIDPVDYLSVVKNKWISRPICMLYWLKIYKEMIDNKPYTTWDYQWILTVWRNEGFTCRPSRNLVKNIGFNENATHTNSNGDGLSLDSENYLNDYSNVLVDDAIKNKCEKYDEDKWALINIRTVLLMYFPWIKKISKLFK